MAKTILIAATALAGGVRAKSGEVESFDVAAGDELTSAKLSKLGLDADAVADLVERGVIVKAPVREAEADVPADTAAIEAKLAAETKRADDAEAKVKDLETKLAAAEKAAKPAAAQ